MITWPWGSFVVFFIMVLLCIVYWEEFKNGGQTWADRGRPSAVPYGTPPNPHNSQPTTHNLPQPTTQQAIGRLQWQNQDFTRPAWSQNGSSHGPSSSLLLSHVRGFLVFEVFISMKANQFITLARSLTQAERGQHRNKEMPPPFTYVDQTHYTITIICRPHQ